MNPTCLNPYLNIYMIFCTRVCHCFWSGRAWDGMKNVRLARLQLSGLKIFQFLRVRTKASPAFKLTRLSCVGRTLQVTLSNMQVVLVRTAKNHIESAALLATQCTVSRSWARSTMPFFSKNLQPLVWTLKCASSQEIQFSAKHAVCRQEHVTESPRL